MNTEDNKPVPNSEEPNVIHFDPTAHLSEEQKKWRVARMVPGSGFYNPKDHGGKIIPAARIAARRRKQPTAPK